MNNKREKDEHLERLWYMKEDHKDSMGEFRSAMDGEFKSELVDELISEGLAQSEKDATITLTKKGELRARQLIRAHRIAERLLHDVLKGEFETGACEFEHTVTPELVDSICTLLGHPKECPHGMPIPEGECCKRSSRTAESSVTSLSELEVGQCARVAYVNCRNDSQLHKIDGLHIRPGATVKLHQVYPTYVVECEGANIALDKEVVNNICVWKEPCVCQASEEDCQHKGEGRQRRRRGFWNRFSKG